MPLDRNHCGPAARLGHRVPGALGQLRPGPKRRRLPAWGAMKKAVGTLCEAGVKCAEAGSAPPELDPAGTHRRSDDDQSFVCVRSSKGMNQRGLLIGRGSGNLSDHAGVPSRNVTGDLRRLCDPPSKRRSPGQPAGRTDPQFSPASADTQRQTPREIGAATGVRGTRSVTPAHSPLRATSRRWRNARASSPSSTCSASC